MKSKVLDQILDDAERERLEDFASDEVMLSAVKKILLFPAYGNGTLEPGSVPNPRVNFALGIVNENAGDVVSDEEAGRRLKVAWQAIQFVEQAFEEISHYEKVEEKEPKDNPAV